MRWARAVLGLTMIGAATLVPPSAPAGGGARAAVDASWPPIYLLRAVVSSKAGGMRLGIEGSVEMIEAAVERGPGGRATVERLPGSGATSRAFPVRPLRLRGRGRAVFVLAIVPRGEGPFTLTARAPRGGRIRLLAGDDARELIEAAKVGRRSSTRVRAVDATAHGPAPGTDPLPPEVYAFYYQWYVMHHWTDGSMASDNVNPLPYNSGDEVAIARHIAQAQQAGLDGFLVSWIGAGSGPDQNTQKLVSLLPPGFGFAMYVEIHYERFLTMGSLLDQLEHVLETYATHPNYLRYRGKPLIYVFSSLHVFRDHHEPWNPDYLDVWARVKRELERRGHEVALVGEGRPFVAQDFEVFTGMHQYMTNTEQDSYRVNERMSLVARAWAAVHGGERRFFAATPFPGYDDRHIPGRPWNTHFPREDGALYRRQWASATAVGADQALVVSFNEWFETTNIEPNSQWGVRYLQLTRELSDAFRSSRAL